MKVTTVFGLPAHPLLVHLPIVLIPLVALIVLGMAISSRVRDRLGWCAVVLAGVALAGTHLAVESGEALEDHVGRSPALHDHTEMADYLRPFVFVMFVVIVALMALHQINRSGRSGDQDRDTSRRVPAWIMFGVTAAMVATTGLATFQLIRVGHSGAKAAWGDVVMTPTSGDKDD